MSLRIVFMGTSEFAVASLETLVSHKKNIVAVVTAEDKPQGRGLKLIPSPIKVAALNHGLKILQPAKLKSPEFLNELKYLQADLQIVVAFRMLPQEVWSMPPKGTFNLHASLLPQYRGAAPINWAIINGEKEAGVTTFFLQHEIDTGEIIFQEKEPILESDDVGTVYDRLMKRGAALVLKTVEAIEKGTAKSTKQVIYAELKHAPKIFKETCEINWSKTAREISNFIRGLSPYPSAWTKIDDKIFKIYKVEIADGKSIAPEGTFKVVSDRLLAKCKDAWLSISEFQPEGKKRMKVIDYLRGNKIDL